MVSRIKKQDNYFPTYIDIDDSVNPSSPVSGIARVYFDSADSHLKIEKSDGTVIDLENTATDSTTLPSTSSTFKEYIKPHTNTSAESLVKWRLDEDTNSYISFENGTGTNALYAPFIRLKQNSTAALPGGFITGEIHSSFDSGSTAALVLLSRIHTGGAITIRPLLDIQNGGSTKYSFTPASLDLKNTQSIINATINTSQNAIKDGTTNNAGDMLTNNGAKFVRFARGSAAQNLRVNSAGTDVEWITIPSFETYLIYPSGATDYKVIMGSDGAVVYTSSNGGTADALGALQFCRDAIGNTSPGGIVKLTAGTYPVSATFSLTGSTHRFQTYEGVGNGSAYGPVTEIKVNGNFPAVTIDGSSTSAQGHGFRNILFTHNTVGYSNGLIRIRDHAVECTFDNLAFNDNGQNAGDCFKMEIIDNTALRAQYENRVQNCSARGFDNFIHANMNVSTATFGSFMSSLNVDHCNIWNAKRVLKVDGVSGGQILDWHFDRVVFQYSGSNSVGAGGAVFDYDSSASCWNQKHSNCMIWDISTPGINYANVGTSVELALNECNPAFRIGGSGAYLNKVRVTDYYLGGSNQIANSGRVVPPNTAALGEGLLAPSSVLQTPTVTVDSTSPYLTFASGTVQGTNTGTRRGGSIFRMDQSPYLEFYGGPNNTAVSRVYIGFGTNVSLGDTDTLIATTDSGIFAGWRSTDTNIMIFHHNGDGTAMTAIDTGLAKVTSQFKFGLICSSSSFQYMVATANGSVVSAVVTGKIPAASTGMSLSLQAQNTTTTSINQNIRYAKVVLRNY